MSRGWGIVVPPLFLAPKQKSDILHKRSIVLASAPSSGYLATALSVGVRKLAVTTPSAPATFFTFYLQTEANNPTSGLEPLTCSLRVSCSVTEGVASAPPHFFLSPSRHFTAVSVSVGVVVYGERNSILF